MTDPISVDRLVQELEKLHGEMTAGKYEHGEYDQRLARVIGELRDRGLDAERPQIGAKLEELLERGIITPAVKNHIELRLGLR
jgi:hypothetical protein